MNLKEVYSSVEGNYQDVLHRFKNEERVKKYLLMLLKDQNDKQLKDALDHQDYQHAFIAIHTIKGIVANLGLTRLFHLASNLTEVLREQIYHPDIEKLYLEFEEDYLKTIKMIESLDE